MLYNFFSLMREIETQRVEGRLVQLWRWSLTSLVLLSLMGTLATRFQVTVNDTATVQCTASQSMRQHMNRDEVQWAAPILQLSLLEAPAYHPHVTPAVTSLPTLLIEENLYNRPPPSC
jgi:hypothetical protein